MVMPTIKAFSNGYYVVENIYVEPHGDNISLQEHFYQYIKEELYDDDTTPIMMKHKTDHFTVEPSASISIETMGVPEQTIDDWDIRPPEKEYVLLAKPEHARYLHQSMALVGEVDEQW